MRLANLGAIHRGWKMCGAVSVMQFVIVVMVVTVASLFTAPMCEKLGCSTGEWMTWTVVYSFVYFGFTPLWGNLLGNRNISFRLVTTIGILCEVCCLLLFAFCTQLWQAYLAGALYGMSAAGVRSQLMPNVATNWFARKNRGKALGIMNSADGIGGIVFPPIIAVIIQNYGPQMGYLACCFFLCVMTLPFTLFFLERLPEDCGCMPEGYDPYEETSAAAVSNKGVSARFAIRHWLFYLLCISTLCLAITGAFKRNLTGMCVEFLDGTIWEAEAVMISALCLSCLSASDLISNILLGSLIDRFGVKRPMKVFLALEPCIYLSWLLLGHMPFGMYLGSVLYGLHGAVLRNALPEIVRMTYGPKDFARIFSRIYMWKGLMTGVGSTFFAYVFDWTGSYVGAVLVGLFTICVAAVGYFIAINKAVKDPYRWHDDVNAEQIAAAKQL